MPLLTAEDHVTSNDSSEVDEELPCSEHRISAVSDQPECVEDADYVDYGVSVGDKTDIDEGLGDCDGVTVLSQLTKRDITTFIHPEGVGGSADKGHCEVALEKKETILNHVGEGGQLSRKTSKVLKSSKHREKSEDGEKQRMEVDESDSLDGGWGYMVIVGTFLIMTVVAIVGPGFGILFSDFLLDMKASSTITTAIFNSESFAWSVSNLLAGPLTEHFGWRAVGTMGGLVCCTGLIASAFAPSPSFLFFSHSVLTGFGSGSSCLAAFAVIPHYFRRLLGRANGITTAGLCVGGMIGPPMVTYLQEQFGFRGATLIVAALALHICLAASLFRPVQKASKVKESAAPRPGPCQLMGQLVCSLGRNCLLLKSPRVMIIAVGGSFVVSIFLNLYLLVPFVMKAKGHTQETAAWCMSISNLCNLAARLVISSCADMAWFNVLTGYITFATLLSLGTIAFGLLQDVVWVTVALAVCGTCCGACMFLYQMIMLHYMGLKLYVGVMGVSGIANGLWMLCSGPLFGTIRDWSGSYTVTVSVLGSTGFLAVGLFLLLPAAVAYDKRKEEQQRVKDAEIGG